jgi:D-aspartate ligase
VLSSDAVGLGAVRSLARGNVPTTVLMMDPWEPVRASRYADKILVRRSRDMDAAILDELSRLETEPPPVLIPTTDHLAYFVSKHRSRLEPRFRCCIPPEGAINTVLDKSRDTRLLAGTGVPLPRTVQALPSSPADLIRQLGVPLIVKPRTFADKENLGWRNVIIQSLADAEAFYRDNGARFGNVIAQELIPGPDEALWECICLFNDRSEVVRAFTFRKLSTMPAHYGATARGRSERSEVLVTLAAEIGKRLGYTGIADIDVKYDARDGQYKYLELNPRLGLCHSFGTRCGVNVTLDAYRLACGEAVSEAPQIEGRTFLAILEETGARLQNGDSPLALVRTLLGALAQRPVGPYFAPDDMLPGPFALARVAYRFIAKLWRGQLGAVFTKQYQKGV